MQLITEELSRFGAAAPFMQPAAEQIAALDASVGQMVWVAGQALSFVKAKCDPELWADACGAMGIGETRARQFISVFERFERDAIPTLGRQLLIEVAAPGVPESARQKIIEQSAAGTPPTVREAQQTIRDEKAAQAPARELDHDVDRTRMAPEPTATEGLDAIEAIVKRIKAQVRKAIAICSQLKTDRAWALLETELSNFAEDVRNA